MGSYNELDGLQMSGDNMHGLGNIIVDCLCDNDIVLNGADQMSCDLSELGLGANQVHSINPFNCVDQSLNSLGDDLL